MKLDIKSIIILALFACSAIFFGMWYFNGSGYKKTVKDLENKNKSIELVRDSLKNANEKLKKDYTVIQSDIDKKNIKINSIETELAKTKSELNTANTKVKEGERNLAEIKNKVAELEKNPIKREDDALINSLKEKLK